MPRDSNLDALDVQLASARPGPPSFDERRAIALATERLLGKTAQTETRLERYVVRDRLGSGGNGVVYRAWDPILRRSVALKLLRRTADDPKSGRDGRAAVLAESRRCANVDHPNVARVFAVAREASVDAWFIVMELLPGRNLRSWVDETSPNLDALASALAGAARGLDAAHQHGVVHGDFKPDNVLFDAEGVPRVADFGGRGTPKYVAPEVVAGAAPTQAADIHAFGVTVAECWGENRMPARLSRMLDEARSKDPARRPVSAMQIVRAMRPRRWLAPVALGLGVVGAAALSLGLWSPASPCALDSLSVPADLPASARVGADGFVERWNTSRTQFCDRPTESALRCLERSRGQWNRVAALLVQTENPHRLSSVVDELRSPDDCADHPDEAAPLRLAFEALEFEIQSAENLGQWGDRGPDLLAQLREIRVDALRVGDVHVEAEATLYSAYFALRRGAVEEARADNEAAYLLATRIGNLATAFFAAANLVRLYGDALRDPDGGIRWMEAAERATLARDERDARSDLLLLRGYWATVRGEYEAAIEHFNEAEPVLRPDQRIDDWLQLLCGRGRAKRHLGRWDEALLDYQRGLARLDATIDRDTAEHACVLNGLGTAYRVLGQLDAAADALERLLKMMELEMTDSPDSASALGNLAQLNADRGLHDKALEQFQQVHDAFVALAGPKAPATSMTRYAMAEQLFALDRDEEAVVEAEAALRWNAPEPYNSGAQLLLARLAERGGDAEAARTRVDALLKGSGVPKEVRTEAEAFRATLPAAQGQSDSTSR